MAHIEFDHETAFGRRPAAMPPVPGARPGRSVELPRTRPSLPKFCRVNAGQIGRTLFLVLILMGFWQLPHPERLAPKGAVAATTLKPF